MSTGDAGLAPRAAWDRDDAACDAVAEIDRWSRRAPTPDALPFLLSARSQVALRSLRAAGDDRFEPVAALYRAAVDAHLGSVLRGIADGGRVGAAELAALAAATRDDPVQAAFGAAGPPRAAALQRVGLLRRLWRPFGRWWRDNLGVDAVVPVTELWRLYLPFGQWIVQEKRSRRPGQLFMVGFNGSPGAGKTVLSGALAVVLDHLLDAAEGRAVARSGDDWYLGRAERERLRADGYDPGRPGVSNRALPGTHDMAWLRRNLAELERGVPARMGNFDKKADDQPTGADRYFDVRDRVGVFLFDLWFAGARTDVQPLSVPDGLRRRVAEHLRSWRPVFDRLDALWGFDWPPVDQMLRDREAQERLVEQRRGARGMSSEHIRAFMAYMIEAGWDWRTTSPVPPEEALTFHALRDSAHRVIAVRRGGRTW